MYAKEMRGGQRHLKDEGGGGDGPSSSGKIARDSKSSSETDDFLFGYGNYGDPHAFAPYQLFLLLLDFVFNWTIDLTHEDPLAILVIFVFQSLAIIINLILYIMASANQAMQAGLHRRVTIHHWLSLCICLLYIILTGWWFIWALRKSWPSVSDQFSFTWPASGLQPVVNTSLTTPTRPNATLNATRRLTTGNSSTAPHLPVENEIIKEHYTLWSNGFMALYVCHRIVAILYYFIYLRATFLVLNTPDMDRFLEKKKNLVEKFWEVKQEEKLEKQGKSRKRASKYATDDERSSYSLGLQEYLASSSKFLMEREAMRQQSQEQNDATVKTKSKRQILWADDSQDGKNEKEGKIKTVQRPKSAKSRRRTSVDRGEESHFSRSRKERDDDEGSEEEEQREKDDQRKGRVIHTQSVETRHKHKNESRRSSREEVEEYTE